MTQSALEGTKVVDFTQAMAGPFATMTLGDLGCEVIKVEPLAGDQTRKWAPPYLNGMSSYFLSANRNKKSIAIDLRREDGKHAIKSLLEKADVVIENFRPGTMDKLGLGYQNVKELNSKVVYCSLSGFGQDGPYRDYPGYDLTILSYSGLMGLTGDEDGPPVKFGVPIGDIVSGLFAVVSVLGALFERSKSHQGQFIDLSMLDCNISTLSYQALGYLATGQNPTRHGSAHSSIAPYQAFDTLDGSVTICVGTEKLWKDFARCLDLSAVETDARFITNSERVKNRAELAEIITSHTSKLTSSELLQKLGKFGIPVAPINTVSEALKNEQITFRSMINRLPSDYGEIQLLGSPLRLSRTPGNVRLAPPMLGQHSTDILKRAGIDSNTIRDLIQRNIINSEIKTDEKI